MKIKILALYFLFFCNMHNSDLINFSKKIILYGLNAVLFGCASPKKEEKIKNKNDSYVNNCEEISIWKKYANTVYSFEEALQCSEKVESIVIEKPRLGLIDRKITIPKYVRMFKNLKNLTVVTCDIDSISNIKHLNNLESLCFTGCHIGKMPKELFTLKKIKKLMLRANSLSYIDCEIVNLNKLNYIDFSLNKISHLPKCIGDLKCLKTLDIRENLLTHIPDNVLFMPNISEIIVAKNPIIWENIRSKKEGLTLTLY